MGRLWGVLILQSIQKITIRTRYNRYIYQLKIIVSIFHDRELLSTYLVSSKGYALETIKSILNECVIENALINMGNSSVLALGNHPVGTGWKVNNILLHNECLTTSGNDSPNVGILFLLDMENWWKVLDRYL